MNCTDGRCCHASHAAPPPAVAYTPCRNFSDATAASPQAPRSNAATKLLLVLTPNSTAWSPLTPAAESASCAASICSVSACATAGVATPGEVRRASTIGSAATTIARLALRSCGPRRACSSTLPSGSPAMKTLKVSTRSRSCSATNGVRRAGSEGSAEPTAISCASSRRRSVLPRDHRRVIETASIFSGNASPNISIVVDRSPS